ncbi:MAG: hypothetical protein J0L99_10120 [Chitinophagales bacterium]|nr:hypothetical protein [Chitinophagales bacterium]
MLTLFLHFPGPGAYSGSNTLQEQPVSGRKNRAFTVFPFLALVRDFMIVRKRGNFMLNKADFTGIAGSYNEECQRSAA